MQLRPVCACCLVFFLHTVATVNIPAGTPVDLAQHDLITGQSVNGGLVTASVLQDTPAGSTTLQLRYIGTGNIAEPNTCMVGGLQFNERVENGCKSYYYTIFNDAFDRGGFSISISLRFRLSQRT